MENKVFWKEAPLVRLAVCLMAGIIVGDTFVVGQWLLVVLVAMVVVALLLRKHEHGQSIAIAV